MHPHKGVLRACTLKLTELGEKKSVESVFGSRVVERLHGMRKAAVLSSKIGNVFIGYQKRWWLFEYGPN